MTTESQMRCHYRKTTTRRTTTKMYSDPNRNHELFPSPNLFTPATVQSTLFSPLVQTKYCSVPEILIEQSKNEWFSIRYSPSTVSLLHFKPCFYPVDINKDSNFALRGLSPTIFQMIRNEQRKHYY